MSLPYLQPYLGLSNGLNTLHAAGGGAGGIGGWVELGRTTLGSSGDNISVSSLTDKRYYMLLCNTFPTGGDINNRWRMNSDTGSNYSRRKSSDGGADSTDVSQSDINVTSNGLSDPRLHIAYVANLSSKEKLLYNWEVRRSTAGAGTAPSRAETAGKWANTSNAINEFIMNNSNTGSYDTGSEVVVLGWDPADSHTNNFWEELASVDLSGGAADDLDCTFTAKKYLWIQIYLDDSGAIDPELTFNNDGGSNYATRFSSNGGADGTATSQTKVVIGGNGAFPRFINLFVINNQSNEKLVIGHGVNLDGGAGAANAPYRIERAFKWANTSNQINDIDITNVGAGSFGTNSIIKVWGAD
jgi:hypothetical protein